MLQRPTDTVYYYVVAKYNVLKFIILPNSSLMIEQIIALGKLW
jgi:hypothetical protein